ncbi:C-C chemokine receptor type 5 [Acanthochromis polyacanthus]|uniref:C-C chemokine receptor type 5 n=1 Tax=Acanthochromis polyacanthus TaxID=80966 RepID=UPI00223450AB|nr:C-C chemokine receptor type 5 [Acanthochromis polyacanthus]
MCSMNMSDNESWMYQGDYDIVFSCDEGTSTDGSNKHMVLLVLYYVLFCLGLLGNSTVLWVLLRHIKVKTMTDVCLLNLVLSDLLLTVSLPLWAYSSQNLVSCKLITGVYQLGFYSGTLFVTLMSVDRYLAIVHAVAAVQARTLRYGITASVITWVISVIMATPQVIFVSLEMDGNDSHCHPVYPEDSQYFWKLRQNFSENTVGLFVCLPIIVFCYVKILVVLSKCRNSKKNRAVKLIFTIVCVFVVCWVPYNVLVFLQTLEQLGVLNNCNVFKAIGSAMGFAEIIALSHCCINPVVYAFVGEKFRRSLARVLSKYLSLSYLKRNSLSQVDTTEKETSHTPVRSDY